VVKASDLELLNTSDQDLPSPTIESQGHINFDLQDTFSEWRNCLQRRGPDAVNQIDMISDFSQMSLIGSILHIRGALPIPQPLSIGSDLLLFNGEIFNGIDCEDQNDTLVLAQLLSRCNSEPEILSVMEKIHGPWAFVYWKDSLKTLFFGRDRMGRRSMLYSYQNNMFSLSSVPVKESVFRWKDLPTTGIFSLNLIGTDSETNHGMLRISPWKIKIRPSKYVLPPEGASKESIIPTPEEWNELSDKMYSVLFAGMQRHIKARPSQIGSVVALLFSGGVDSSVLGNFHTPFPIQALVGEVKKCGWKHFSPLR